MTAPIDLEHLNRYVFGDAALLAEVLGLFKDQAAQLSETMGAAIDADAWRQAAHTLKGAARGVGAWALGEAAERAEGLAEASADERASAVADIAGLARNAADYADAVIARAA